MKRALLAIISAIISVLFFCPTMAYAITPDYWTEQVVSAAPEGGQTSCGEYTVSPGDSVRYYVALELPDNAALISIQPHDSLEFVIGTTLRVINEKNEPIYTQGLGHTSTDGYFYDLSKMSVGGVGYFTYEVSVGDTPNVGLSGMRCNVVVTDAKGKVLTDSESPAVYSLSTSIQTVDTHLKERQTEKKNHGVDTYNGQRVEGAIFSLFYDDALKRPVSFKEGFRIFTVCPGSEESTTQVMKADVSGCLTIRGLRAGTYYLVEEGAPIDYYNATTEPIVISLDLKRDSSGNLKMVTNETPPKDDEDTDSKTQVVKLRSKGTGAAVILDYRDENKTAGASKMLIPCLAIIGVGIIVAHYTTRTNAVAAYDAKALNEENNFRTSSIQEEEYWYS